MANESEMIRQQMDETRTALTDKIGMLEQQLAVTVEAARTAVAETVGGVQEVVQASMQTVKDAVQETVEAVKGTLDLHRQVERRPWAMVAGATALGYLGSHLLRGSHGKEVAIGGASAGLGDTFHAEISQLRELAVGALLGIIRDIVTKAVPVPMERQVEEIMDGVTVKLGGRPLDGRMFPERPRIERLSKNGKHGSRIS